MASTYRAVLGIPGAAAFSLSGLVGRLPISMVGLGVVVLVSQRTGSYSLAGSVSASFVVANALVAVFQARLVDRLGQSRVLPAAISVSIAALVGVMWAVEAGITTPWLQVLAAVSGAAMPQVGSSVRARWSHVVRDKVQLQTAFAVEAVNDELVFIVGPTLVTLLATSVHPLAGLGTAAVAGLLGTLALTSLRATEPPAHRPHPDVSRREAMGWRHLGPMVVCSFAMGVLFGGCEVATVAFADELGRTSVSGPLLAVWALGSLISGAATGTIRFRTGHRTRFSWGLLGLGLLMVPLPFVEGFLSLGLVLFLAGFAISPTLIAATAWIEETVPATRITEGITVFSTGLVAGVAPGAAVVGAVVDQAGASAAYWVPAFAGLGGAVIALATAWPVRPRRRASVVLPGRE